jgi:hypothetical protein
VDLTPLVVAVQRRVTHYFGERRNVHIFHSLSLSKPYIQSCIACASSIFTYNFFTSIDLLSGSLNVTNSRTVWPRAFPLEFICPSLSVLQFIRGNVFWPLLNSPKQQCPRMAFLSGVKCVLSSECPVLGLIIQFFRYFILLSGLLCREVQYFYKI